jgi:hypothetical protein
VPPFLSTDAVVRHMSAFGGVVHTSTGTHRLFPHTVDGVLHLTMQLDDPDRLTAYLPLVDEEGLATSVAATMWQCGARQHSGLLALLRFCRALLYLLLLMLRLYRLARPLRSNHHQILAIFYI